MGTRWPNRRRGEACLALESVEGKRETEGVAEDPAMAERS
jgi:hypothetical protein